MTEEELKDTIQNICYENPKAIKYSIVRRLSEAAESYATSQTEALKKEIEELKAEMLEMDKNIDNDYCIPPPIVKEFKVKVKKLIIDKSLPKIF